LRAAEEAARSLAERGLLLDEHVDAVVERAGEHWDWVMSRVVESRIENLESRF
jgi:hypothetical protein